MKILVLITVEIGKIKNKKNLKIKIKIIKKKED